MEKNVSRNLMDIEQVYDNLPQHIKEYACMPNRYFDLTNDQQRFFDVFAERAFFPLRPSRVFSFFGNAWCNRVTCSLGFGCWVSSWSRIVSCRVLSCVSSAGFTWRIPENFAGNSDCIILVL